MTKHKSEYPLAFVVLAAGLGTRMKSSLPKVMHRLAGRPMILHLLETARSLDPDEIVVVVGEGMDEVAETVAPHPTAVQSEQLGTGHALGAALGQLEGFDGDVLVLYGADPLVTAPTLERLLAARRAETDPAVAVLGFRVEEPGAYGRLITAADGALEAVVEAKDATPEQLAVGLCNSGVMAFDGKRLADLISAIGNDNAKREYYLTDSIAIARARGWACAWVEGAAEEHVGVDSRADLAVAEAVLQTRLRAAAMAAGVTLSDPTTVYFSADTELGRDVTIGPHVVFGPGVRVADGAVIKGFCHIEGAAIGKGAVVGPFARLRPGADLGDSVHIGNFVEVKNATLGPGAKANHLAYVGDSTVGAGANIGAGAITCNYDGYFKSLTEIGAGAFIGSNTALVAPVRVGDGAIIGAGSVITRDVAADALAVERAPQKEIGGWAGKFRKRRAAEKAEDETEAGED